MAVVLMRHPEHERLTAASEAIYSRLEQIVQSGGLEVKLRGPMPAPISRIQRFHRMHIIAQAPNPGPIQQLFAAFRASAPIRPAVQVQIDIDPVSVL